ncbi:hypothetical protein ORV05_08545 [Amycolatopsis cynarae]|uniref:Uncharacterized protein n=1 Tax=Amycolatopsis cynarae TaxID=2995223 RepID=A0ABY7BCC2_9PSEU|nr:hypothetical protein [Amycolatopsis sp. HUAS 11-8]WAL70022.1 hypothetical protein ORV05_08545 [Amycolatopsis sp. HUAS 11-8]
MRARIVREVLSESQELSLLQRFCDLAISLAERRGERPSASLDRLHERIDDLSIHLPSDRLAEKKAERERPDDLGVYRELAEDRHGELVREERIAQAHVIAALDRLTPPERYFGVQGRVFGRAAALREWRWIATYAPTAVRSRDARGAWLVRTARAAGRLTGSLRNRTLYL